MNSLTVTLISLFSLVISGYAFEVSNSVFLVEPSEPVQKTYRAAVVEYSPFVSNVIRGVTREKALQVMQLNLKQYEV